MRALRPSEVCRLLNSTQMGSVLDERQVYRHRMRAGFQIGDGSRIDLLRYIAWLFDKRRSGAPSIRNSQPLIGHISVKGVHILIARQSARCALTGRSLNPEDAALDHVLPISRGGTHQIENAQILHKMVNKAKGCLTNEEFIQLCREVVQWADSKAAEKTKNDEAQNT